jgi:hypothetical protein
MTHLLLLYLRNTNFQILHPLCATLLHYMKADETFASVIRFLGTGSNYLIQSDVSLYASFHTLLALLKKHRHSAYNFLKRRVGSSDDVKLAEVFRPWSEWIFKHLPFDYLVRIMDCYLVEGTYYMRLLSKTNSVNSLMSEISTHAFMDQRVLFQDIKCYCESLCRWSIFGTNRE